MASRVGPLRQPASLLRRFAARSFASEAGVAPGEIGEISGIPQEHLHRRVLVYSPVRTPEQQGQAKTGFWRIRFESTAKWQNPLMGWTSTADPLSFIGDHSLNFDSKEAAVEFAVRQGWEPTIAEPQSSKKKVKAYADNFKWKGPPPGQD